MLKLFVKSFAFLLFSMQLQAQAFAPGQEDSLTRLPSYYLDKISSRADQTEQNLDKKAEKVLQQMMRQEARIIKKLSKKDSVAGRNILITSHEKYKQLEQNFRAPGKLTNYLPKLDTLATFLKFIENNPQLLSAIKGGKEKLEQAMTKIKGLENQLRKAEDIKKFLKERKQFLKEQLSKLGFAKELKKLNKRVYYYNQQVNEYRELFKDSRKAERKVIELLSNTRLFRDFMKKNSMLASFFPMPGGNMGGESTQGAGFAALQTRVQVTNFIQQAGVSGPNAMSRLQQNIQNAGSQLDQLRNRLGSTGDGLDMPDFKPNSQKTKSFFKRLEYGTTFQSQKANRFFPVTSDIGLSVGYKLNDKSVIGIAASYKIGLGKGWNDIRISNQGVGLRSFIDWKIKGSFWFSGGYEQNYKPQLREVLLASPLGGGREGAAWQQSGLMGISKIVSLKSKFFKKTKLQLLWDFLSYRQKPITQPLLFRIGYNF